uniref:Globoside alpha-1,3-N-acetylgalactosaminyltransferase 1 (FORS blood group) n=1 Tax=Hucho hucho TaxID=62062 RepID=A0A4W5JYG5_9TELE
LLVKSPKMFLFIFNTKCVKGVSYYECIIVSSRHNISRRRCIWKYRKCSHYERVAYDALNISGRSKAFNISFVFSGAPIVWEGTFNPLVVDSIYKPMHLSIATTVFAVGKYVRFLRDFLETAEKNFMVDFKVRYYIFTHRREDVPAVVLAPGRNVTIIPVPGSNHWQEISSRRMEIIQTTIGNQIGKEADYIFCLDVDTKLVATIHPGYYEQTHEHYPYERRPASRAYIPAGEGDYYYGGATIAGYVGDMHKLAKYCREQLEADAANSIEAAWQEESHLNRYLLYKPTKTNEVQIIRFSQVNKNYAEVRPNVKKRK